MYMDIYIFIYTDILFDEGFYLVADTDIILPCTAQEPGHSSI